MSWIAIEDVVDSIDHLLRNESIHGPVNVCAPNPVTNEVFTETLGKVLPSSDSIQCAGFCCSLYLWRDGR